jgi:hypothetical protein
MDIQQEARAGRCVPTNRLRPAHSHRHERLDGSAVGARGHAARIVRPLAPQWRHSGGFANLRAFATTLGRKPVAHAVGCIHGRRIEQQYCRDGQCLEEGSHEGEVKVYRSDETLQQIPTEGRRRGGETGGCRMSDSGRGESTWWCLASPPARLWGQRRAPYVYSNVDAGFATASGNPGIVAVRRCSSASRPGIWVVARPT